MKREKITVATEAAPQAIGPYVQGVGVGGFYYFSGQIAIDPNTGKLVDGDVVSQTRQVLQNIDALLKSQGLTAQSVVKTTVFLTDMADFSKVNAEYGSYFSILPPARSCVAVAALPLGARIEIEVIAYQDSAGR